jgi:outer membrane protein assembly factor BamB
MAPTLRLTVIMILFVLFCACGSEPSRTDDSSRTGGVAPSTADGETLSEGGTPDLSDGGYWPRFHGPNGDNLSTETGLLKTWPDEGPPLVWTAEGLGHGFGSVAIADGSIYVSGEVDDKTTITALDLQGKRRWQVEAGGAWTGQYPGTRGTPTLDGGRLYHESPLGDVVCLDAATGAEVWRRNLLKEFEAENITWALAESVLIDGDRAIGCPGGKRASVVAFDKATGETVWEAPGTGDKAGYATPTVVEHQGLRLILTMNQKALIGVSAENGDLLFRHEHVTQYDVNATTPIFHEGRIFITSGYGSGSEMLDLSVDGAKASVKPVWESKDLDNHHGGVLLLDGYVYGASSAAPGRGRWACLKWDTGETMYLEKGVGKGSLTYADGMLYTFSERRQVGLVPATPTAHEVVSQFEIPRGGEGMSWAHPVVCGGRLYLRHSDTLFAYDVRAGG